MNRMILLALSLSIVFFALVNVASAQEPVPTPSDNDVNAIAKHMYCPVCENTPLDVCPTQACEQWRELIREKLAAGWTEKEINDYFVNQYGPRVLGLPPLTGFNWFIYIVPLAALAFGVYMLTRTLLGSRREKMSETPINSAAVEDAELKRVEEELNKRN